MSANYNTESNKLEWYGMNHNLDYLTDDELMAEVKKRQQEKKRKEEDKISDHQNKIKEHISALIYLSEHISSECTDDNPCNHWNNDCPRCSLICADNDNYFGNILVKISVENYSRNNDE